MTASPHADTDRQPAPVSGFRRLGRLLFVFVLIPYLCLLIMLASFQRSLLFPATQAASLPALEVLAYQPNLLRDVEMTTADGVLIRGWLFLASAINEDDPAALDDRWLVIFFHGNAGHRGDRVPEAFEFVRAGCDVLLIDYRGYGDSEGSPSREGLVQDAVATWNYATGELDRSPERIILFGESLGGAVAVELASHCCGKGANPAGMLLTSTFANLPDTAARLYPWFPVRWIVRDRFSARDIIPGVTCPIVQVHGEDDELVTLDEAEELFSCAPDESSCGIPKRFVLLEGVDHNSVPPHALGQALQELVTSLERGP